jgi:hypothetical protein
MLAHAARHLPQDQLDAVKTVIKSIKSKEATMPFDVGI